MTMKCNELSLFASWIRNLYLFFFNFLLEKTLEYQLEKFE